MFGQGADSMVRHSHTVRRQHLLDELHSLIRQLEHGTSTEQVSLNSADAGDWLLRLSGLLIALLLRHDIDQGGRCRTCRSRQRGWRRWILPRPVSVCLVHSLAVYFCTTTIDLAWWQTLAQLGDHRNPTEIRHWLATTGGYSVPEPRTGAEPQLPAQRVGEPAHGRHAMNSCPAPMGDLATSGLDGMS
ncbi:hypothetical protein GCM10010174_28560 [Kutzneria viridogrisea]